MEFIDLKTQQARIRDKIEARIKTMLAHGKYIMGPEVFELEEKLAAYVGIKHCISCASGTDALLMALMALDIQPGDEVITVPYTWISTAKVISLLRAVPVFVDIQPDTFNMDPDKLASAITSRTRGIMPVGIYGQCADMSRINAIAAGHGIPVIEDAAQCFGATHHGIKACNHSILGCTSFFPSKPLGCYGDGGALFTPDDALSHALQTQNIPSVAYYTAPLHLQGAFADLGHKPGDFPVSEKVAAQCLSLPMSPYLTSSDQKKVVDVIKQAPDTQYTQ